MEKGHRHSVKICRLKPVFNHIIQIKRLVCNMRARLLVFLSCLVPHNLHIPKKITQRSPQVIKMIGPLGQASCSLIFTSYSNPQHLSVLFMWLSTFSSGAGYNLFLCGLGRNEEWTSSFLAFSISHCPASTSCLVYLPVHTTLPIRVFY